MNTRMQASMAIALLLFSGPAWAGDDMSVDELPDAVRKTVLAEIGGARITDVERDDDDGQVTYEVEFVEEGDRYELDVASDGTLLRRHRD